MKYLAEKNNLLVYSQRIYRLVLNIAVSKKNIDFYMFSKFINVWCTRVDPEIG